LELVKKSAGRSGHQARRASQNSHR
jgi:hypothetical protein